jgi:hypothetical protein
MRRERTYNRREAIRISSAVAGAAASLTTVSLAEAARSADEKEKPAAFVNAKREDVGSIDGIIAAVYGAISGPAGHRDWDRLRSLFQPGARLIPCVRTPEDTKTGTTSMRVLSVEDFIKVIEPRVKTEGFFEREIARRAERFGAVVHVFSTYESRRAENDQKPFVRGINSFQLFHDGKRWWVVTIFWDSERPDQPIPAEYLPKP